jgi:hypothetical protein
VVLGLSKAARDKLDNDKDILGGIGFRFMSEGSTEVIEVVPSVAHDVTTENLEDEIRDTSITMGVPKLQDQPPCTHHPGYKQSKKASL